MKRIFTFCCLLSLATIVSGQTCTEATTVCAGSFFQVCKTDYTQSAMGSDYGLTLVLTAEGSMTVLQSSGDISGANEACFTFNAAILSPGIYQVRALNYEAAAMNTGLPVNPGDNVDAVGAISDVCYNGNFLTDVRCFEVAVLPVASAGCLPVNEGAAIDVVLAGNVDPTDVVYSLNGGAFQTDNEFIVTEIGDYTVTTMGSSSGCTFDVEVNCLALPLELTALEGNCAEGNYLLSWTTSSERDISHFIVERSTTGTDYIPVGEVAAVGNSTTTQNYAFKDETTGLSRYYYRLHIVETTGLEEYSRVITVECRTGSFGVLDIHPNPTNEVIMISYEVTDREHITLKIADVLGRTVHEEILVPELGLNTKTLDLSELFPAVYIILMDDGIQQITRRVVRE